MTGGREPGPDEIAGFDAAEDADGADAFVVDLDGFGGPLHLLLDLARRQKVDLARVSISALADQYLGYVREARKRRLDIAAEYLVMAAWLAFLKSKLLLPREEKPEKDEAGGDEMAAALAWRLRRLEAFREAGKALFARARLGSDVFPVGQPRPLKIVREPVYQDTLLDLMRAYAAQGARQALKKPHEIRRQPVYALEDARNRLRDVAKTAPVWRAIETVAPPPGDPQAANAPKRSVRASVFSAALELARDGEIDLRQDGVYEPIYFRAAQARSPDPDAQYGDTAHDR